MLALDLNSANASSSLTMGGYDEDTYKGSIQVRPQALTFISPRGRSGFKR